MCAAASTQPNADIALPNAGYSDILPVTAPGIDRLSLRLDRHARLMPGAGQTNDCFCLYVQGGQKRTGWPHFR